jgi:diacylglycerol kinase family enzyme
MDRIVVIANPSASQFTGGAHRDVMSFFRRVGSVEAVWPETATDAEERAAVAAAAGARVVVAMGGDGMVHHVAQGLIDTDAALGIIPVGTTNVIARLLRVPPKPTRAARLISEAAHLTRSIGTARMVLSRGAVETTHHAVFACGVGLDAAVVLEADKDPYRKYRFGSLHYARTAFGVAFREFPRRKPHVTVAIDGSQVSATTALVQFRSLYTYFGSVPLRITPEAPDPMTVLTMASLPRRRIPRIITTLIRKGDLGVIPEWTVFRHVKSLELTASPPAAAQADGEALGMIDAGTVEWAPDSLRVVAGPESG